MSRVIAVIVVALALASGAVYANGNGAGSADPAPEPERAFDTLCDPNHSNYTVKATNDVPVIHVPNCATDTDEIAGLVAHFFLTHEPEVSKDWMNAYTGWILGQFRSQNADATVEQAFAATLNYMLQPWFEAPGS